MGFLGHDFGSKHARRSIKDSIDVSDRLVSNTSCLSQKMAHWIGAQGRLKCVKNSKTCLLCDVT